MTARVGHRGDGQGDGVGLGGRHRLAWAGPAGLGLAGHGWDAPGRQAGRRRVGIPTACLVPPPYPHIV